MDINKYYKLKDSSTKEEYEKFLYKLSQSTNSRDFFKKNPKGEVHSKRKQLHTHIIKSYLDKCPSKKNPTFHFILGSIGSGKTSLKDKIFKTTPKSDFIYINFDEIKLKLPEYEVLKKINPKKASYFVQSESAKIAGILKNKAMKKRVHIVYEKNIRLSKKDNTLRLSGEMKEAFKKGYKVTLHVVFLNSAEEAWIRVQERYKRTKRYVSKEDVTNTFQSLFPNLNRMISEVDGEYLIALNYNRGDSMKNQSIGILWIGDHVPVKNIAKYDQFVVSDRTNEYYAIFSRNGVETLPQSVKNRLKQLSFLKNILK